MSDGFHMEKRIARKAHKCLACRDWLESDSRLVDLSDEDIDVVRGAEADDWMVQPGQTYWHCTRFEDGTVQSHAQRIDMTELCARLGLFE